MSRAAFDAKLAALDALKTAESGPKLEAALTKAIRDRNNYLVAKAAQVAADVRAEALIPTLLEAFERFMSAPAKTDPQCWAKIAIIKALSSFGHDGAEVYIRGLRHVQMEPVWGGQEDIAGPLRASSASALVQCRSMSDLDALEHLLEALVDPDKTVRTEAARAIGRIERREAALVLRQRALFGDNEPEPLAAVYSALLTIEGARAIPFLGRFLDNAGDAGQEAALALGSTHTIAALQLLQSALDRCKEPALQSTLLSAIALIRLPDAFDFLLEKAAGGSRSAFEAIESMPLSDVQRARRDEVLSRRS